MSAAPRQNRLAAETSPYLLQHKDNPVDWWPWGPEALAEAERRQVPILLSVGYAACHWCHVMAHESFEDPEIAALMNALFVNVKVDREERPDIDTIYQSALSALGQSGGWPLTMFLTPKGEPFWGGTYFPTVARYGRPGFPDLLRRVAEIYRDEPATITQNRTALVERLQSLSTTVERGQILPGLLDQVADRLVREVDPIHGGFGTAPKFPQVPALELLWRGFLRTGRAEFGKAVERTLAHMCQGGIYDHLGGGFARYSVDERWLLPHFEKMLYDNALLVELMTLVWQHDRDPLLAERVRETIGWMEREMLVEGAAFASSLDADSEGGEGRFYVWQAEEIDRALGPQAPLFRQLYDVAPAGNWEGYTILNRLGAPDWGPPEREARLATQRARLLAVRESRPRPARDDKVLADWNGMAIAALARAGGAFAERRWIEAAARAFDFVRNRMIVDGRLRHAWRDGRAPHVALLDDHAQVARAALALHEATGSAHYLAEAEDQMAVLDRHFWDATNGGYFLTADDAEALIVRTRTALDGATPSGNGAAAAVLGRLHWLTGNDAYRARAEKVVESFAGAIARNFFPLATLMNAHELIVEAVQVVVIGTRGEPATEALVAGVEGVSLPDRVLTVLAPGTELPSMHPAFGKTRGAAGATAYVCRGRTCSLPLTDPAALGEALRRH
jgi:uncharacterized protein YyaL (SSP411 family)